MEPFLSEYEKQKNKKQTVCIKFAAYNKIHYFQYYEHETIGNIREALINTYHYPSDIVIYTDHILDKDTKIIDALNNKHQSLSIQTTRGPQFLSH